jgi:hypothetical protein
LIFRQLKKNGLKNHGATLTSEGRSKTSGKKKNEGQKQRTAIGQKRNFDGYTKFKTNCLDKDIVMPAWQFTSLRN